MKASLNYIRLLAIIMVVFVHAVESVTLNYGGLYNISFFNQVVYLIFYTVGRLGVPLFLLLTGYLLLDRDYSVKKINLFYIQRMKKLVLDTLLGISILLLYTLLKAPNSLSIGSIIRQILFLEKAETSYSSQVWYMPMIIGIYLFIPIIAGGLKDIKLKTIMLILCVPIFYLFLVMDINQLLLSHNRLAIESSMQFSFVGIYGVYVLLGWCLKQGILSKINNFFLRIIAINIFLLLVSLQADTYQRGYEFDLWYNSILLLVTALTLFELMSRLPEVNVAIITRLTKGVLIVYWVHTIYQDLLWQFVSQIVEEYAIRIVLLTILNLICSMMTALVVQEIKKRVRK